MSLIQLSDKLYEAVNEGNRDTVLELLRKGANVNLLTSCGRTVLGRAAQLGNASIVCLLLDAERFYIDHKEECDANEPLFTPFSLFSSFKPFTRKSHHSNHYINYLKAPGSDNTQNQNCCSPSIDSETCTCSDEVWGHDTSDTNIGHHSDLEAGVSLSSVKEESKESTSSEGNQKPTCKEEAVQTDLENPFPGLQSFSSSQYLPSQYKGGNIGYYVYAYPEEAGTGDSSGPVVSSTEDSDSAIFEQKPSPSQHLHRHSSILLHRTLGRGQANIVSSDSEFETENYRTRRHAKHNHKSHRHDRDHVRHKGLPTHHHHQSTNPFFANLHSEYLSLGLSSPWDLKHSCDINQHDVYGRSALHYATEQEHLYIVKLLTTAGVKVDTPDAEHMTALHLAAQRGYAEIVTHLLDNGAKINNKMNDKSSSLHIAASRGYTDIVETLLNRGAKIDSSDSSDRTPLYLSVSRAHHKVVQLLINRGAKVNIEEIHGYTTLCEAVWQKDVRLVQMLLNARAKVTQSHYLLHYAVLHRHYQLTELLLGAGCIVNLRDDKGDTPLIIAARSCQASVIKLLLKHGANANYPNGLTGTYPIHEAVEGTRDAQFDDFIVVFNLLKTYGAKLDVETLTPGDTPLYRAIMRGKNKAAALLIRRGCDVNIQPPAASKDYLHMAAIRNNHTLATLIIYAGFNLNKSTWLNGTHAADSLNAVLASVKSSPLKLMDQCRISIRRKLGENVYKVLVKASLPEHMINFLMLNNVG